MSGIYYFIHIFGHKCFPSGSVVKNLSANAEDAGDRGSITASGKSPGEGNGNPLKSSYLKNFMGRLQFMGSQRRTQLSDQACLTEHILLNRESLNYYFTFT